MQGIHTLAAFVNTYGLNVQQLLRGYSNHFQCNSLIQILYTILLVQDCKIEPDSPHGDRDNSGRIISGCPAGDDNDHVCLGGKSKYTWWGACCEWIDNANEQGYGRGKCIKKESGNIDLNKSKSCKF
jgi:hypothetical protein